MDALQNFSPEEIRSGCRDYLSGPDCDRKPKPGDIRDMINRRRAAELAKWRASQPAGPQPRELSEDERAERRKRAEEIMRGFSKEHVSKPGDAA